MSNEKFRKVYVPCIIAVITLIVGVVAHRYFDTDDGTLSDWLIRVATSIATVCFVVAYNSWKALESRGDANTQNR